MSTIERIYSNILYCNKPTSKYKFEIGSHNLQLRIFYTVVMQSHSIGQIQPN